MVEVKSLSFSPVSSNGAGSFSKGDALLLPFLFQVSPFGKVPIHFAHTGFRIKSEGVRGFLHSTDG